MWCYKKNGKGTTDWENHKREIVKPDKGKATIIVIAKNQMIGNLLP